MAQISEITRTVTETLKQTFPGDTSEQIALRSLEHERMIRERVAPYTKLYEEVSRGSRNVSYLVNNWLVLGYQLSLIDYVNLDFFEDLVFAGTLLGMLDTMIDDIVDDQSAWSPELARLLLTLEDDTANTSKLTSDEELYYKYSKKIWNRIIDTIKTFPQFTAFSQEFQHSINMLKKMFQYCIDVREERIMPTYEKSSELLPHNLTLLIYSIMTLMTAKEVLDKERIEKIKEVVESGQKIQHWYNLLATYAREADEGDMTNELVCLALENGEITIGDIKNKDKNRLLPALKKAAETEEKKLKKELEKFDSLCYSHPIVLEQFRIGVLGIGILYNKSASRV